MKHFWRNFVERVRNVRLRTSQSPNDVPTRGGSSGSTSYREYTSTEDLAWRKQRTPTAPTPLISDNNFSGNRLSSAIGAPQTRLDSLGELALQAGFLDPLTLREALAYQAKNPALKIGQIFVALHILPPEIVQALVIQQQALRSGRTKDVIAFAEYVDSIAARAKPG